MDVERLNVQLNFCIGCEPTEEAVKEAIEKQCSAIEKQCSAIVGDIAYLVDDDNGNIIIDGLIPVNNISLPMTVSYYKQRAMNDSMLCPPDFDYSIKDCKEVFGQETITIDDWILYTMVCHALCDMLCRYDDYKYLLCTYNDTDLKRQIKNYMLEECNGKV